jgi:carbon starvation protein
LAVLVIAACAAGLGLGVNQGGEFLVGQEAWAARYTSWADAGALRSVVGAFVDGAANFLQALGVDGRVSVALMGVLVASFAGTTMDTACRLQRYVVQELARVLGGGGRTDGGKVSIGRGWGWLENKHGATIVAVVLAAMVAAVPPAGQEWTLANAGKGGLLLWPLFGATNQLLGGLSFLVVSFYLWRRGGAVWFIVVPMIFMLVMPPWAMVLQMMGSGSGGTGWVADGKWLLVGVGMATILLEIWMVVEAVLLFPRVKGVLEREADSL